MSQLPLVDAESRLPPGEIESRQDDVVAIRLELAADHPVFAGHFPGHPILPGVAQIDWAMALAVRHLGLAQRAASAFQVKFRRVIRPPARPLLQLEHDRRRRRLLFRYVEGDVVCSQGSIALDGP